MPEDHPGYDGEHQPDDRRCYDPDVGAVEPRREAEVPQRSHSIGRKTNYLMGMGACCARAHALVLRVQVGNTGGVQRQNAIEGLVGEEVAAAINGQKPIERALADAERRVNNLLAQVE